tara:strand:- start:23511 stop:23717 length:207 start_codon:yes stop_codon:yes gene_type:complete
MFRAQASKFVYRSQHTAKKSCCFFSGSDTSGPKDEIKQALCGGVNSAIPFAAAAAQGVDVLNPDIGTV